MRIALRTYRVSGFLLAILVISGLLLCDEVRGKSEKDLVDKARVKIMLKEYDEAAAILEEARQKYPASVPVAEASVTLHEETKADVELLMDAYKNLIRLLELKKVTDESLNTKDSRLLRQTEKKLAEVAEIRLGVDAAVKEFTIESIKFCRTLAKQKKYVESSFVYQRLSTVTKGGELESEIEELAEGLKGKAALVKMPGSSSVTGDKEARKLILNAQKLFKKGKYDEARLVCKAALEADPEFAPAWALLCDIAQKTGDTAGVLKNGLTYLLFHPEDQSAKRAERIEKQVVKSSPELRAFFSLTAKSADTICKLARKAIRGKKNSDLEYALGWLVAMTHRTRKVDNVLSKASSVPKAKSKNPFKLGRLLISEDFSKESKHWYQGEGLAFFKDGKYHVKSEPRAIRTFRYYSDLKPGDFFVEAEMQLIDKAGPGAAAGFCFRLSSDNTYYAFMISADGKFGAWLLDGGRKKDFTGKEEGLSAALTCCVASKEIKHDKAKNILAVGFVGSKLYCFVNKRVVFTCEDDTYKNGLVGFIVAHGGHEFAFDNFKLYEATIRKK